MQINRLLPDRALAPEGEQLAGQGGGLLGGLEDDVDKPLATESAAGMRPATSWAALMIPVSRLLKS
jgi:hypothetical protein